ncbi:DUF2460 domain-containing protein [Qipengyuania aquimaris]|uniref:DUF2460 domain-containing protein n=1 Tax=Qipengyuania aquimaris TaxID=255984 RepID=UPI001CD63CCB|nr:DUF2460 domain-containing protein [Qipengyuania aquimaris]MCA0903609.1 DUF2460 domain-containing protein [Qipengyuania aquimaris]
MAFWLAKERTDQHKDWIQRFDPRFWTVNFPRPMMASVVTTGPDALRVDCEFLHEGELAGLIWESEDTLDHPLFAYKTERDYSHCILRFRWQSSGVLPLDAVNGPTLTIEGRDAAGQARSWYVRLWNYAAGSPQDAQVELKFSSLEAGWSLPGETVWPKDIDRMFISIAPSGYVQGSSEQLAEKAVGAVSLTAIEAEGDRASIEIGDAMVPPHGEQIATAYDDSYNQTPARLLRTAENLGYRGRIVHYVGMSHFMSLLPSGTTHLADPTGELAIPARRWHESFFAEALAMDFAPIVSLSFELFDAYCPPEWKQRAHDGGEALTGWEPPSTLLSPANPEAMQFLQGVATRFVDLLTSAGGAALFQIGEPWWWVRPSDRAPCLYDPLAITALPSGADAITDMRAAMDNGQIGYLDAAGALLAQATADLAQAVRDAAPASAEILLLAFTPTVLDPEMPELHRACLPAGWAAPAFDRLQLEDYDWLTSGRDALRRSAYAFVDQKLAYPPADTDYLSGFVLDPADAKAFWPSIDAALDEARDRDVDQRFVWALPQIARDGYVRLPPLEDSEMQAFDDVAFPLSLGRETRISPEFSTTIAVTSSGHERRNALWSDARMQYDVGPGVRSQKELVTLINFFRARYGPARGFRLRDPYDFSSRDGDGDPTMTDELIGQGDGVQASFQLVRNYGDQTRLISRPVEGSIVVSIDASPASGWAHVGKGEIRFDTPPPAGSVIRAGFLFDVPVRFAEDRLDISGATFAAGEAPSVPLIEIREDA